MYSLIQSSHHHRTLAPCMVTTMGMQTTSLSLLPALVLGGRNSQLRYWHPWLTESNQLISTLIKLIACGAGISPGQAELLVATASRVETETLLFQTSLNQFLMGSFNLLNWERWKLAATRLNCLYFRTLHWKFSKTTTMCWKRESK